MNLNDFQIISVRGLAIKNKSVAALAHRTLGLNGEAGIISNAMKKVIRDNDGKLTEDDRVLLQEKLGDMLFIWWAWQILRIFQWKKLCPQMRKKPRNLLKCENYK